MQWKCLCKTVVELSGQAAPRRKVVLRAKTLTSASPLTKNDRCLRDVFGIAAMLTLSFVLIALTGFATAQETNRRESDEAKAEVLKVSERISKARAAKDRTELERILADGLVWTARGDRLSKDQVIADMLSDKLHFKSFAHDSVAVKMFGSTVVLTRHSTSVLEYKGKLFDAPQLFTDVYVKMDGRWQLVVHDVFELPKS
jgi:hypothetical protein